MRYVISAMVWFLGYILGFFVTWIGLLFCSKEDEHMPKLFWPWDNYDGINGTLHGHNPIWPKICGSEAATRTFWNRWIWVTWRNPVSNLSNWLGREPLLAPSKTVEIVTGAGVFFGCPWVRKYSATFDTNLGDIWQWQFALLYGEGYSRKFWIRLGWKLSSLNDDGVAKLLVRITPGKFVGNSGFKV